jgi:hypothetical protein
VLLGELAGQSGAAGAVTLFMTAAAALGNTLVGAEERVGRNACHETENDKELVH